jgi:hypothetical protein
MRAIADPEASLQKQSGAIQRKPGTGAAYFSSPINVATAAGARVTRIVVHSWIEGVGRFSTWSDVAKEVQMVWKGEFRSANSSWSESVVWTVSASIEFENSKDRGCLMTDGTHVSLGDVSGGTWLLRLLPAAQ